MPSRNIFSSPADTAMREFMPHEQFSAPKRSTNRRRSQRLILKVPVIAYRIEKPDHVFIEGTHTLVVSAHGALINLNTKVMPDQKLVLKHVFTGEEQECRVVFTNGSSRIGPTEVGIEFRQPAPGFWRVPTQPSDWLQ